MVAVSSNQGSRTRTSIAILLSSGWWRRRMPRGLRPSVGLFTHVRLRTRMDVGSSFDDFTAREAGNIVLFRTLMG